MTPSLDPGDRVIAVAGLPARGDIVVFTGPDGMVMTKRVIGIPDDHVRVSAGVVRVNGEARVEVLPTSGDFVWPLDPDSYVVLSDARDLTVTDSRTFGPIAGSAIIGTVKWRYWPLTRVGRVRSL